MFLPRVRQHADPIHLGVYDSDDVIRHCYSASFNLPSDIAAGMYSVEVKNNLAGSTYSKVGSTDPTQAVLKIVPTATVAKGTAAPVECCNVDAFNQALNSLIGKVRMPLFIIIIPSSPKVLFVFLFFCVFNQKKERLKVRLMGGFLAIGASALAKLLHFSHCKTVRCKLRTAS